MKGVRQLSIKERHENLRGGEGVIVTYTNIIFLKKRRVKIILMKMSPRATIGLHEHTEDSEIYMTMNRHVRFGLKKKRFLNFCLKGRTHSASNQSDYWATVFAIKF